jgi:hypothetical protein
MCEFCEAERAAASREDAHWRCNKCRQKVCLDKDKCDKEGCDGVPLYQNRCDECGNDRPHRPGAWICEDCIYFLEMKEKSLVCAECTRFLPQSNKTQLCDVCDPDIEIKCVDCSKTIDGGYYCENCLNL